MSSLAADEALACSAPSALVMPRSLAQSSLHDSKQKPVDHRPAVLARLSQYAAKTSQLHVTQQKDFGVSVLDGRGLMWCIAASAPGSIASGEGLVYARMRRCAGFRSVFALRATRSLTP